MKIFSLFFLSIALLVPVSLAGNFGPAPFRNGSPLVSGVDGTYQATARAQNVTGIFRFAYSGGSQTASQQQNNWIFFVNGEIQKGSVAAAINESNLSGILDNTSSSGFATNSNGAITFPIILVSQQFASAGSFSGKINLKNPSGAFNGSGVLLPAPTQVETYTIVNSNAIVDRIELTNVGDGRFTETLFQFRGVRTSITSPTAQTNSLSN